MVEYRSEPGVRFFEGSLVPVAPAYAPHLLEVVDTSRRRCRRIQDFSLRPADAFWQENHFRPEPSGEPRIRGGLGRPG